MLQISYAVQLVIAVSIAYVWIVRFDNIVAEFREYGYSDLFRNTIGAAKIALSTLLVVGIWYPAPVSGAALGMGALMVGAQYSHWRTGHAALKYLPSFVLLLLSIFVAAVHAGMLS